MPRMRHHHLFRHVLHLALFLALAVNSGHAAAKKDQDADTATGPAYVSVGTPLVINLARDPRPHYLRASIQLETRNAADASELEQNLPLARDYLIGAISGRAFATVSGAEGQNALRATLLEGLNERFKKQLGHKLVDAVYFTDYIVE